ncbi:hypothetical protein JIG36_41300 [Actinoplanes sp. LDG1-06]|uniref:DUF2020 domain-containing protein n=1 Tax=Paractinoplanes ovalisporus TaxID=2810368 RepID=A0ABS2AQ25_9ACTN|nr:hypothetical protein [Actinoplanes ovalisporus]MBM2621958.1 hypothetical protein [Actinoplanes ovalisporus]
MNRTWQRVAAAAALVMAVAGCTPDEKPAPASPVLSAGCPKLSAVPAAGERQVIQINRDEQEVLERIVPGARIDYVVCQYPGPPDIAVHVRAFQGEKGPAQATALADAEQSTTSESGAGFVTVPAVGDSGGFAWSDEPEYTLATHAGNAYVVVIMNPGTAADSSKLTTVMTDVLKALS